MPLPGIGLFGTGTATKCLVPILQNNKFRIEAVWSERLQEAQSFAFLQSIPFYTDRIDDVLLHKAVDLVFILCNPGLHAQISVKALGIGKHVVCDWPAGLSQTECLKMVHASQYYPSLISIVKNTYRFLPTVEHLHSVLNTKIDTTELFWGRITMIDVRLTSGGLFEPGESYTWKCDDCMGGGVLNVFASNIVDLVTFLTGGQRALRVHALTRTFTKTTRQIHGIRSISAPDFCTFQMELDSGVLVVATLNAHLNGAPPSVGQEIMVCSEGGELIVRNGQLFGRRRNAGKDEILQVDEDEHVAMNFKGASKLVAALKRAFQRSTSAAEDDGWVKEPVRMAASFEDALYVHAVLDAMRESAKLRQWRRVEILTEAPETDAALCAAVRKTTTISI